MSVWITLFTIEELNELARTSLIGHLGIRFTGFGDDYLQATMQVDHRTMQPFGILHGGASVALAESLGSIAANQCIDQSQKFCVGLEINANHIRTVRSGLVTGTASPIHIGQSTQVWEIKIRDEQERLVCVSRFTVAVLDKKKDL